MLKNLSRRILSMALLFVVSSVLTLAAAQAMTVKGVVHDSKSEPLIGATVKVKNTAKAVVTDIDGKFALAGVMPDAVLEVSYVGYTPANVKVNGRAGLDITLKEDNELLNEVVVIGYGTMDKKELTSAISHVSEKDFLSVAGSDPAQLIQGKVPGVSIVNTGAADPNNMSSIQIRGVSSRSAGLGPLIVIDGVPGADLNTLNPEDIASFDVLKDGAASAIYGTRGSNGVILVTTKKGTKDGNTHVTYRFDASWDWAKKELDFLNADEYRELRIGNLDNAVDLGGDFDWWKGVQRTGFSQHHTLSVAGGNDVTNYRVSADYRKANGIDLRSDREEYGGRANINYNSKNGLFTFTVNLAPRIISYDKADWSVFCRALETNPTTPLMDPDDPTHYYYFDGQSTSINSVEVQKLIKNHTDQKVINMDGTARLNILPLLGVNLDNQTLSTQVTFAEQHNNYDNSYFVPSTANQSIKDGKEGSAERSQSNNRSRTFEWLANYSGRFGSHNVKLMGGYSWQNWHNSSFYAKNSNFPNDALGSDNLGSGTFVKEEGEAGMGSDRSEATLISFFGRVSYDYMGKYLLTASIRHEGSSRFGKDHKWGNFPAVSAGWRISQEGFMKEIEWINELKIRADYGVTGNQDFASYKSLDTMGGYGDHMYNGKWYQVWGPNKNVNTDLHWEKGHNFNVGIDFSLFRNRFSGSVNYFNRRQSDLLGDYTVPVPPFLHSNTFVNVGTMRNSGVEFDFNVNAVQTKDFDYTIGLVASTMSNKFVDFSNSEYIGQDYYNLVTTESPYLGQTLQRIEKGKRIGNFYMWRYAGFTEGGDWLVYDKDGQVIEASKANDEDRAIVGNGLPKFTMSMTHTFRWRNFDLSLFFRGAFGFDIFNIHDFYYGTRKFNGNTIHKAYEKNFNINPDAVPVVCDYFMERGDYLKLDQINLGYTFNLQKTRFLNKVRLYGTVKNVFTITKYSGVDPSTFNVNGQTPAATGTRNYFPTTRQLIVGAQIDF